MNTIDIEFNYRNDSKCGDPDTDSEQLYNAHKLLWSKELPNGEVFCLDVLSNRYGRLVLKNNMCMNLSSDRMCPHYVGKYNNKFEGWFSEKEQEELKYKVRTIGGHIIFPAHKNNGFTINQARGVNRKICDRFDLTFGMYKALYLKEESPPSKTLLNYKDFFELFVDFEGYCDFFYLQDFIDQENQVVFSLPFDDFNSPTLPQTVDEYRNYKNNIVSLINKRNNRIIDEYLKLDTD